MDDLERKEILFERNEKSKGVAYLLWFFLGLFGAHRFYAGKTKSAVLQLILSLTGIGVLLVTLWWWIIDAFLVPDMINQQNLKTIDMIYGSNTSQSQPQKQPQEQVRELPNDADPRRQAMLEDLKQTGYRKTRRDDISRIYR